MKKSLLLLVVAIFTLTTAFEASAKWTDRNTFNLKGPVKAVENQFNEEFLESNEFKENGDIIFEEDPDIYWANIDRDNKGRITYIGGVEYSYNNKGQVVKVYVTGGQRESTTKYYYNAKGQVIKAIVQGCGPNGDYSYTTTYTYQKFDSYGNWIKRTAKTGKKRTVQTRTITYY